ncbi:hypothetical protein [Sedimenticola hydrogenitrophicus]|uniref:hypothetical protein n=1 Tax=Sedimenticola hydrogenitrophicus TaxID=2967975 RepID=UPI0021A63BAF|nr:hypothetical protein [Sedimenticola hydrogenitrophicus]
MKNILIATALASLFAVGAASADIQTDLNTDLLYGTPASSEQNFTNLPATGAGRTSETGVAQEIGGMQDKPSERVSGI